MKPTFLALGLLIALSSAVHAAPAPAVTVVQKFIDARSTQHYAVAYALLSHDTTQNVPYGQFSAPDNFSAGTTQDMSPALSAVVALFTDTHTVSGYSFTVSGTAPALPNTVLVTATSTKDSKQTAQLLKVVVVTDPLDVGHLKLDLLQSLNATDPVGFKKARQNAERAASESNLRQIALGVIVYAQDHDERMPDADKWVDELMPFLKTEAVFHDPSAPSSQKWSYAFNKNLSGKSFAQLEAPADTVMLFESTLGVKNASDTGQSVPVPGRHRGGTDYAKADGHVVWYADGTKLSYLLSGK